MDKTPHPDDTYFPIDISSLREKYWRWGWFWFGKIWIKCVLHHEVLKGSQHP